MTKQHVCFTAYAGYIRLEQNGFDSFTVVYGLSVRRGLSYEVAAADLGACIMHYRAAKGQLDARTRAEARSAGDRVPFYTEQSTNGDACLSAAA